jgi:type I restriction enzyme, R subunit
VLHVSEPGSDADRSAEFRDLRERLAADLRKKIAGMSLDNFLVRPKRRFVEKYESRGQAIRPDRFQG